MNEENQFEDEDITNICRLHIEEKGEPLDVEEAIVIFKWLEELDMNNMLYDMYKKGLLYVTVKDGEVAYSLTKFGKEYSEKTNESFLGALNILDDIEDEDE